MSDDTRIRNLERDVSALEMSVKDTKELQRSNHETIIERLDDLKTEQTTFIAEAKSDSEKVKKHDDTLYQAVGDGPGVVTAVDRLTQDNSRFSKFIWIVLGALIPTLISSCGAVVYVANQ